jgi:hypothetical protein
MKNTLKIVFLGIIGFSFLVYLTAPKNVKNENKVAVTYELHTKNLPKIFDIVGNNPYAKYDTLFKNGEEKYIVVLNHDSLAVFKDLYKFTDKNVVLIANISNTPWLIKKIAVDGELENMYKESKIPLINDENGNFIRSLNINDNTQNAYFTYKINIDGTINYLNKGFVKLGALEKGISEQESQKALESFSKAL